MTTPIVLFLVFGACFGLATFSRRHLFSEGPTRRHEGDGAGAWRDRALWVLTCTCLWPIMALTGLYSMWILARRRAVAARKPRDAGPP